MSYSVKQGDIFGRIGTGVGQGLAEQVPKEIERNRLSTGLQQFTDDSANLSPIQQLARLSAIPGITPQMIQSFGELAKQQAQAGALGKGVPGQGSPPPPKFPSNAPKNVPQPEEKGPRSITTTPPIKATIENYVPKTYDQILDRAGELFNANTALYKNDPQAAVQAATQEDQQNQAINTAQQNQRKTQQDVQSKVQQELQTQAKNAGVEIPDNVYSDIENRALEDVNSGKLTELESAKKYKKELDNISRDYESIKTLGTAKLLTKSASGNKESLRSLRKKFKARGDLENFADTIIAENKLSPSKAYYLAYPVSDIKGLNNEITSIPDITPKFNTSKGLMEQIPEEDVDIKTAKIAMKLGPLMGTEGSPLAIAEELKSRGYNPMVWLNYVDRNRKKLNLSERQGRELDKPRNFTPTVNDLWMFYFSGLDKLVEQK